MNEPNFANPYKGIESLPSEERFRFQSHVPEERFNYFKGLRLKQGTIIITVNTLIEKLYHELKRRGVKDLTDRQQFEQFVTQCQLVLPGEVNPELYNSASKLPNISSSTTGESDGVSNARDDRSTVERAVEPSEKVENLSDIPSSSKRVGGARGKRKQ